MADNIRPVIHQIEAEGYSSLRDIAEQLNRRGVKTARGDPGAHTVLIRSGRLALDAQHPRQHHRPGAAATIARVEPGGECLAIHARQLVVEPDLQILRRHRRAVLPSLEQPHRPTMEDHVPRHAQMGAWVLINDRWYKGVFRPSPVPCNTASLGHHKASRAAADRCRVRGDANVAYQAKRGLSPPTHRVNGSERAGSWCIAPGCGRHQEGGRSVGR